MFALDPNNAIIIRSYISLFEQRNEGNQVTKNLIKNFIADPNISNFFFFDANA